MKLISMTDFVLERSDKNISEYTIAETFKNGAKITNEIFKYAKFLEQPLKLEIFVPCDEYGNLLNTPDKKEIEWFENQMNGDFTERYTNLFNYFEAKEKVLFEGFELIEISKNLRIIKNQKQDCQVFANQVNNIYYKCSGFETIEDLVKYNIELTQTAIKQLGL